jgi:hypothetical protein
MFKSYDEKQAEKADRRRERFANTDAIRKKAHGFMQWAGKVGSSQKARDQTMIDAINLNTEAVCLLIDKLDAHIAQGD